MGGGQIPSTITFRCLSPDAKLGAFFWDKQRAAPRRPLRPIAPAMLMVLSCAAPASFSLPGMLRLGVPSRPCCSSAGADEDRVVTRLGHIRLDAEWASSIKFPDGLIQHFEGAHEDYERLVRAELPDGQVQHYEGEQGKERVVRVEQPNGQVQDFESSVSGEDPSVSEDPRSRAHLQRFDGPDELRAVWDGIQVAWCDMCNYVSTHAWETEPRQRWAAYSKRATLEVLAALPDDDDGLAELKESVREFDAADALLTTLYGELNGEGLEDANPDPAIAERAVRTDLGRMTAVAVAYHNYLCRTGADAEEVAQVEELRQALAELCQCNQDIFAAFERGDEEAEFDEQAEFDKIIADYDAFLSCVDDLEESAWRGIRITCAQDAEVPAETTAHLERSFLAEPSTSKVLSFYAYRERFGGAAAGASPVSKAYNDDAVAAHTLLSWRRKGRAIADFFEGR